jgi:hypothetical protein
MDTIDYNNDLNIINGIAKENGYNPEMIDTILRKLKNKTQQNNITLKSHLTAVNTSHKTCHINILQ